MAENTWKAQGKQSEDSTALSAGKQRKNGNAVPSGQAVLFQALLSGVSPENLSGLTEPAAADIPNSVILELLSRRNDSSEMPFHPLPEYAPETKPFIWSGSMEMTQSDMSDTLPPPLDMSAGNTFLSF